jgi:hypothetical protein
MLKWNLLFLLLTGSLSEVTAQQVEQPLQKNSFFLELGGNSLFYSLNYDRILLDRSAWKLSGRIGGMYFPGFMVANRHMIGIPVEVSYLRGNRNHHLEIGLGFTPIYDTYPLSTSRGEDYQWRDLVVLGVARIGYRYQKREGGFFFKTGFTPLLGTVHNLREEWRWRGKKELFGYPLAGLAFGYTLKR